MSTSIGSPPQMIVVTLWFFFAVSVVFFARTSVTVDGTTLRVQGRLRRQTIDMTNVWYFQSCDTSDAWAILLIADPANLSWASTVTMVHQDGSEHDLRSVNGSKRACGRLASELNRVFARQ